MRVEQAKRIKELEKENTRLRKLVAELSLDNSILKEAAGVTSEPVEETKTGQAYKPNHIGLGNTGLSGARTESQYP